MGVLLAAWAWLRKNYGRFAPGAADWLPRLGIALLLAAAVFSAQSWRSAHGRTRSVGTVIENIEQFAPGGGLVYRSRVRFRAPTGGLVQVLDAAATPEPEFAVGQDLPVLYPPGQPQSAVIATVWRLYRTAIWLAIGGVVAFDLGWFLRLMMRGRKIKLGD